MTWPARWALYIYPFDNSSDHARQIPELVRARHTAEVTLMFSTPRIPRWAVAEFVASQRIRMTSYAALDCGLSQPFGLMASLSSAADQESQGHFHVYSRAEGASLGPRVNHDGDNCSQGSGPRHSHTSGHPSRCCRQEGNP